MILRQAEQSRHVAATEDEFSVMGRGLFVGDMDVNIGLDPFPQEGGGVGLADAETEPVVQQDQIGRILAALRQGLDELALLFLTESAADAVDLELGEVEIPAKRHQQFPPRLRLLRRVAVAVGTAPHAETDPRLRGGFRHGRVPPGILLYKLRGSEGLIGSSRSVQISGVPGVDLQLHPVGVAEPLEIIEIRYGLRLRRSLVGAVYP